MGSRFGSRRGRGLALAAAVIAAGLAAALATTVAAAQPAGRAAVPGAREVAALLRGIPQRGATLGSTKAPLVVVEYADIQCVYCARFARETLPAIVRRYVRTGRVRLVFRGLAFLGPDSATTLRWTLAAGRQNRLWNVLELLFVNQGEENSGWATQARLDAVARSVPGLDLARLRRDRAGKAVAAQIAADVAAARKAGVTGTPSFQAGPSLAALRTLQLESFDPDDLAAQLERLLRG